MEVVYSYDKNYKTIDKDILGLYGDITYLDKHIATYGIDYNDNWTVRRFLNGYHIKLNSRIKDIFNYLEIDIKCLDQKLSHLSHTTFKYVMLAYLLLNNMRFIIFDHFDAGLTYKAQKKLIGIINKLKEDGFSILVISNNFVFLSKVVNRLSIVYDNEEVFDGTIEELLKNRRYIKDTQIIDFIEEANKHKAKLKYTFYRNVLLKDIYRSVS
jgi:ABC-type multidrug transport system ATPase subunit